MRRRQGNRSGQRQKLNGYVCLKAGLIKHHKELWSSGDPSEMSQFETQGLGLCLLYHQSQHPGKEHDRERQLSSVEATSVDCWQLGCLSTALLVAMGEVPSFLRGVWHPNTVPTIACFTSELRFKAGNIICPRKNESHCEEGLGRPPRVTWKLMSWNRSCEYGRKQLEAGQREDNITRHQNDTRWIWVVQPVA